MQIRTADGGRVPFNEVADFTLQRSERLIRRENGYRSLRVMAGVDTTVTEINLVMKEVNDRILPAILAEVEGVTLSQGGQAEWVNKMIKSMIFSMALALLVMFTLLLFQMKSWGQALLVLSLIPLGFLGAVYGHMIMGKPISFISFLGSVALGGIIVNDSVVLIDCFNKKIRIGIPRIQAAHEAAPAEVPPHYYDHPDHLHRPDSPDLSEERGRPDDDPRGYLYCLGTGFRNLSDPGGSACGSGHDEGPPDSGGVQRGNRKSMIQREMFLREELRPTVRLAE